MKLTFIFDTRTLCELEEKIKTLTTQSSVAINKAQQLFESGVRSQKIVELIAEAKAADQMRWMLEGQLLLAVSHPNAHLLLQITGSEFIINRILEHIDLPEILSPEKQNIKDLVKELQAKHLRNLLN